MPHSRRTWKNGRNKTKAVRRAAGRKSGAEVRSILQQMERTQVYLSAAGRQELAFWKGGAA